MTQSQYTDEMKERSKSLRAAVIEKDNDVVHELLKDDVAINDDFLSAQVIAERALDVGNLIELITYKHTKVKSGWSYED